MTDDPLIPAHIASAPRAPDKPVQTALDKKILYLKWCLTTSASTAARLRYYNELKAAKIERGDDMSGWEMAGCNAIEKARAEIIQTPESEALRAKADLPGGRYDDE